MKIGFRVNGPLRGHVCSVAGRRGLSKWQAYVRLLANMNGVPSECPKDVEVRVYTFWKKKARIDTENVGKVIVDSLWNRDRGVRKLVYQMFDNCDVSEFARVEIHTT